MLQCPQTRCTPHAHGSISPPCQRPRLAGCSSWHPSPTEITASVGCSKMPALGRDPMRRSRLCAGVARQTVRELAPRKRVAGVSLKPPLSAAPSAFRLQRQGQTSSGRSVFAAGCPAPTRCRPRERASTQCPPAPTTDTREPLPNQRSIMQIDLLRAM